jgi:hypothetical protein|tara:strand:- start:560 stop:1507 length:948 start_codon:yes stop_codon:yes gene_type:complete
MGHNDHYSDDRPELPPQAGNDISGKFEPDDGWFKSVPEELQIEAMRRWFYDRYEDPQNKTPYSSEEGCYIFVWGGPYDPNEVIQDRFSVCVDYGVMEKLIQELHQETGYEWAPIEHDYYEDLSMLVLDRTDPFKMLTERLTQIESILTLTGNPQSIQLTTQLAHGALIIAMEAYLWDTVAYWVANDEDTLRNLVATNKDFQIKTLQLSKIFERVEGLKAEVELYLQDLVWHRLDKIKPLIASGLKISVPDIDNLMREVLVRHDIIHRGGRTKDGEPIEVSIDNVRGVAGMVQVFADAIEAELALRYPASVSEDIF